MSNDNSKVIRNIIDTKGFKFFKSNLKEMCKNDIPQHFEKFYKDLKVYPLTHKSLTTDEKVDLLLFKNNRHKLIIFEIENDENKIEYPIKDIIIPFGNFFISSNIIFQIDEELIIIDGFFVLEIEGGLYVSYFWSKAISEGWALQSFFIKEQALLKNIDKIRDEFIDNNRNSDRNIGAFDLKISTTIFVEFFYLVKKILYLIETKKYNTYKKWIKGKLETHNIIYAHDVKSHKRHFWEDSGRFKIPLMDKEKLKEKGYLVEDELVSNNGELRRDVPYRIINSFHISGENNIDGNNRKIELLRKKIYRKEEKLGNIIREIFPNEVLIHNKRFCRNSRLTLDWNIWKLRLGFEYDGEQHFDKELYTNLYGDGFEEQVKRDKEKDKLCLKKGIRLIRIRYDEPLTKHSITKKLKI